MLIAHVSDFHVFAHAPETSLVRADAAAAARKVVSDIATFSPGIDAVMLTGDLTDGGSADDYALLSEILSPLNMPVFVVPGNHDTRDGLRTAFGARLPFGPGPYLNYEAQLGDLRILALDTLEEGHVEGRLETAQLEWLRDRLALPAKGRTLILMHHPAFPSGMPPLDRMSLREGRDEFGELIEAHRGQVSILSGHIHRPFQMMWHGHLCAVGGSPAFHHELLLARDAPEPGAVEEPYSYFIHKLDGANAVCIHNRYVSL